MIGKGPRHHPKKSENLYPVVSFEIQFTKIGKLKPSFIRQDSYGSCAPSFSNQEPRAHKLFPELLPTIQEDMKREGWSVFRLSSSARLSLYAKKRGRLTDQRGWTAAATHSDLSFLSMISQTVDQKGSTF